MLCACTHHKRVGALGEAESAQRRLHFFRNVVLVVRCALSARLAATAPAAAQRRGQLQRLAHLSACAAVEGEWRVGPHSGTISAAP